MDRLYGYFDTALRSKNFVGQALVNSSKEFSQVVFHKIADAELCKIIHIKTQNHPCIDVWLPGAPAGRNV